MCVQYVGKQLPYDNITELRERMADVAPHLVKNDVVESPMWLNGEYFKVHCLVLSAVERIRELCFVGHPSQLVIPAWDMSSLNDL